MVLICIYVGFFVFFGFVMCISVLNIDVIFFVDLDFLDVINELLVIL